MPSKSKNNNPNSTTSRPRARRRVPRRRPRREVLEVEEELTPRVRTRSRQTRVSKPKGIGHQIGGFLGNAAESLFRTITGVGDYSEAVDPHVETDNAPVNYDVDSNTLLEEQQKAPVYARVSRKHEVYAPQIPTMNGPENGGVCIRHREYVRDIPMFQFFDNAVLAINPSNAALFPWLSTVANNFEQYRFIGCIFEFRSLSANALSGSDPSMGSVTLATQYDVDQNLFVTKKQALNSVYATSCKPAENMIHPIECEPNETPSQPLYIHKAFAGNVEDLRLVEQGRLNVITEGSKEDYPVAGELWVTYEVFLFKPRLINPEVVPKYVTYVDQFGVTHARHEEKQSEENKHASPHQASNSTAPDPHPATLTPLTLVRESSTNPTNARTKTFTYDVQAPTGRS